SGRRGRVRHRRARASASGRGIPRGVTPHRTSPLPRIVSLLSSATETACALGLAEHIVGISHECDYPPEVLDRPRVSSTKIDASRSSASIDRDVRALVRSALSVYDVNEVLLAELAPDVVLTQDHCRVCA